MATFNNGESGSSVRTKINNVLQHADGTASELVINDAGADVNFRVESDTNANALFVDGGTGGGDTDARCLLRGMLQRRTSVGTWHVSSRLHAPDVPTCACALRARAVMAPGDRGALVAPPVDAMDSVAGRLRLGGIRWAASDGRPRSPSVSSAVGGVRFGVPARGASTLSLVS